MELLIESTVRAPPETVFDVYTDHRRYAALIGPVRSVELEREGEPAPNGVGAIRRLRLPAVTIREQVTAFERPGSYSYRMLSGAPFDEYASTVTFTSCTAGTRVSYRVRAIPALRLLPVGLPVKRAIRTLMRNAAAAAERLG